MPNYRLPGGLAQITVNGRTYRADASGLVTATGADAAAIAGAGGLVDGGAGSAPEWSLDATGTADGLIGPDGTKATGNTAIAAAALAGVQASNTVAAGFAASVSTQLSGDASALPTLAGSNSFTGQNTFSIGTITTSKPFALSQTWNAGGVTFAGFTVNVTDTASATGSMVGSFQLAGANLLSVNKNGNVNIGARTETGKLTVAGLQGNYWIGFYDGSGNPYGGIGHGGGGFFALDSGSPVVISTSGTTKFKFNTSGIMDFTAGTISSSVATASTHKLTITVAGATYYLLATNV